MSDVRKRCPDDGTCHHSCAGACFRVLYAGPLSGVYPGDRWPEGVRAGHKAALAVREDAWPEQVFLGAPSGPSDVPALKRLADVLRAAGEPLTAMQAADRAGLVSREHVAGWLEELEAAGLVRAAGMVTGLRMWEAAGD